MKDEIDKLLPKGVPISPSDAEEFATNFVPELLDGREVRPQIVKSLKLAEWAVKGGQSREQLDVYVKNGDVRKVLKDQVEAKLRVEADFFGLGDSEEEAPRTASKSMEKNVKSWFAPVMIVCVVLVVIVVFACILIASLKADVNDAEESDDAVKADDAEDDDAGGTSKPREDGGDLDAVQVNAEEDRNESQ